MNISFGLFTGILTTLLFVSGSIPLHAQSSWFDTEEQVQWLSLSEGISQAQNSDKIILISVLAENCPYCRKMENNVYSESVIQEGITEYFLPVVIDVNESEDFVFNGEPISTNKLLSNWNVMGTPTTLFVDDDLKIIAFQPGYLNPGMYNKLLHFVGSGAYATTDFEEFEMDHDH